MPNVLFQGPAGRLEGFYRHNSDTNNAPIALLLHPLPQMGGSMNVPLIQMLYRVFAEMGFSTLRFNFRGIGRSQGIYDNGVGEMADATAALDWLQANSPENQATMVAGYSFGAWVAMQLLMRRPEIGGFITIAPPVSLYDFSFLAPCPTSGFVVTGERDKIAPKPQVKELIAQLEAQKGLDITSRFISGANHFFEDKMPQLENAVRNYTQEWLSKRQGA